jgi:sugar lactone lactonase YvrE
MKNFTIVLVAILLQQYNATAQKLEKIWETDSLFKVPESVLFEEEERVLFVSNIDGASGAKDGKGFISKLSTDGKIIKLRWVDGLHAPKGMAVFGANIYVTDVDAIVTIERKSGKIISTLPIPGAKFLNDITVDPSGNLYASDSETGIIHKIVGNEISPFITGLKRPNGVLWYLGKLFYVDAGGFFSRDKDGKTLELAKGMETSTDGIEAVDADHYLISSWVGAIYFVAANGTVIELLNTKAQKINTADIGYNPSAKIIYVPTFFGNRVVAYKLVID